MIKNEKFKGKKIYKKLGLEFNPILITVLYEISRIYLDRGYAIDIIFLTNKLNLSEVIVSEICFNLDSSGFVHLTYKSDERSISSIKPSSRAYSFLRDIGFKLANKELINYTYCRHSKVLLDKSINIDTLAKYPNTEKQIKWKRIKISFKELGLTAFLYEKGIIDFKGRNTTEINERIALNKILKYIGEDNIDVIINNYMCSISIDLGKYLKINIEDLSDKIPDSILYANKIYSFYNPEISPNLTLKIQFKNIKGECIMRLWAGGKIFISGNSNVLLETGIKFLSEYLLKHEMFYWKEDINKINGY